MTTSKLEEAIMAYKNKLATAEENAVFFRKGSEYIPLENVEIKDGMIKIFYQREGEHKTAYVKSSDLYDTIPQPFRIHTQRPTLKAGDYIKIKTRLKTTAPFANNWIREQHDNCFKIEGISSRGFYLLNDGMGYLYAEEWLSEISRQEFEEMRLAKPVLMLVDAMLKRQEENLVNLEQRVSIAGREYQNVYRLYSNALELRYKSKDEVKKEKSLVIKRDLALITKDVRVDRIDVDLSGSISVITKPLSFTNTNVPLLKKFSGLPPYKITFSLDGISVIKVCHMEPLEKFGINNSSHCHPHVGSNGDPCMGNLAPIIHNALASFEIMKAFKAMAELLESYHTGNPYIHLNNFYKDPLKCESCESSCVTDICENCGEKQGFDKEDLIMPTF